MIGYGERLLTSLNCPLSHCSVPQSRSSSAAGAVGAWAQGCSTRQMHAALAQQPFVSLKKFCQRSGTSSVSFLSSPDAPRSVVHYFVSYRTMRCCLPSDCLAVGRSPVPPHPSWLRWSDCFAHSSFDARTLCLTSLQSSASWSCGSLYSSYCSSSWT